MTEDALSKKELLERLTRAPTGPTRPRLLAAPAPRRPDEEPLRVLGTTRITRQDGTRCACAIDASGRIYYEAAKVPRGAPPLAPGAPLSRTGVPLPGPVDVGALVTIARARAKTWRVTLDQRSHQWTAHGIFGDRLVWFAYPRRVAGSQMTRGPAFPGSLPSPEREGLVEIVAIEFSMRLVLGDNGEPYYESGRLSNAWRVKYNGEEPAPDLLPPGTLIAVFLARSGKQKDIYWDPGTGRDEVGWLHLKIGSILHVGRPAVPADEAREHKKSHADLERERMLDVLYQVRDGTLSPEDALNLLHPPPL